MPRLPHAILFDLDDTIISAYGRPELAWAAVISQFSDAIAPSSNQGVLDAVQLAATEFWADPAQHRIWRQRLRDARREIVARAFADIARQGESVPPPALQHRLADRFSDYRDEQMHI